MGKREWTTEEAAARLQQCERDLVAAEGQHTRLQRAVQESAAMVMRLRGTLAGLREAFVESAPAHIAVKELSDRIVDLEDQLVKVKG